MVGPENTVFVLGSDNNPSFNCSFEETPGVVLQWLGFANPDYGSILASNAASIQPEKYQLEVDVVERLEVLNPVMADGGAYQCRFNSVRTNQAQADLIIIGEYTHACTSVCSGTT